MRVHKHVVGVFLYLDVCSLLTQPGGVLFVPECVFTISGVFVYHRVCLQPWCWCVFGLGCVFTVHPGGAFLYEVVCLTPRVVFFYT